MCSVTRISPDAFDSISSLVFPSTNTSCRYGPGSCDERLRLKFRPYYKHVVMADSVFERNSAYYTTLCEAVLPGVPVVAIFRHVDAVMRPFITSIHDSALGYYDVRKQTLHIGTEPEDLGIVQSELKDFRKARNGEDDTALVLLFNVCDMFDDNVPANASLYTTTMEGLYHRMHVNFAAQSTGERAANFDAWARLASQRLDFTTEVSEDPFTTIKKDGADEDDDEPEVTRVELELETLRHMEDLWPRAVDEAYCKQWASIALSEGENSLCAADTCPDLAEHHLERLVPYMSAEGVSELEKRVKMPCAPKVGKLPFAEALYPMALAACKWPSSARCTWITACVQGALACKAEEGGEQTVLPAAKRRLIANEVEVIDLTRDD